MLDIDIVTILAEIINFLVVAIVLYFVLFKPITKRIKLRAEEKDRLLTAAQEKEDLAAEKLAEVEQRLAKIDLEIEEHLQKAYQEAQSESQTLLDATQEEAKKILKEAESEAAKRQKQEMDELQEELADTILTICGQVISKSSPDAIHDDLINKLNEDVWDLGKNDMRQVRTIRDALAEREPTTFITTAKELTPEQQRELIRTFAALADRNIHMEIEINPDLLAGIKVRLGDLVVENSLAMGLMGLRSEVIESLKESVDAKG